MAFDLQGEFGVVSDAIASGTFDPVGSNSTTFNVGTGSGDVLQGGKSGLGLPSTPTVPAVGGTLAQGSQGIANAANAAGITGGGTPPASTTGTTANTAGVANSWFARGAIVILGFVFVAVGLSQFGVVQRLKP